MEGLGSTLTSMRGNLPGVAPFIFNHAPTIAIRRVEGSLYGKRSGFYCPCVRCVGVRHIDIEEGWSVPTNPDLADHDDGVTNADFGRTRLLKLASCSEDACEESQEFSRIWNDDSHSDRVPTLGGEGTIVGCFLHFMLPQMDGRVYAA